MFSFSTVNSICSILSHKTENLISTKNIICENIALSQENIYLKHKLEYLDVLVMAELQFQVSSFRELEKKKIVGCP